MAVVVASGIDRAIEHLDPPDPDSARVVDAEPSLVTVVLADEQPVVRRGLRALLSGQPEVVVVADAASARDAIRLAALHRPCVLVIDVELPGFQADGSIREVLRATPSTAVLVFTAAADDTVVTAIRAGARGYVLKSSSDDGILRAVRGLAAGEAVLGPGVMDRLLSQVDSRPAQHNELFPGLSPRELDVLELMASGMRNAAIAARLHLSPKTVANRISLIFSKLQVAGRAEAIELVHRARRGRAAGAPRELVPLGQAGLGAQIPRAREGRP